MKFGYSQNKIQINGEQLQKEKIQIIDPSLGQEMISQQFNEHFTKITMNRPHRLNSVNVNMANLIKQNLKIKQIQSQENNLISTFMLTGQGDKAFSSGGDLRSHFENLLIQKGKYDEKTIHAVQQHMFNVFGLEYNMGILSDIVQVSLLNGFVMGQGAGFGMLAPVKIVTQNTVFAMPEGRIGFFVDAGGSYFLTNYIKDSRIGMYLALTGRKINGIQMIQQGLGHFFVPSENIAQVQEKITDYKKSQLYQQLKSTQNLQNQHSIVIQSYQEIFQNIQNQNNIYISEHDFNGKKFDFDFQEQIIDIFGQDSLEKIFERLDQITGQQLNIQDKLFFEKIKSDLNKSCPWSLYTNFELFKKSRTEKLSLKECVKLDFRLAMKFWKRKDFQEGIRCMLVDRKDTPVWEIQDWKNINQADIIQQLNEPVDEDLEQQFEKYILQGF